MIVFLFSQRHIVPESSHRFGTGLKGSKGRGLSLACRPDSGCTQMMSPCNRRVVRKRKVQSDHPVVGEAPTRQGPGFFLGGVPNSGWAGLAITVSIRESLPVTRVVPDDLGSGACEPSHSPSQKGGMLPCVQYAGYRNRQAVFSLQRPVRVLGCRYCDLKYQGATQVDSSERINDLIDAFDCTLA